VQGQAHLEAFAAGLGVKEVLIASRGSASSAALAEHARALGLQAEVIANPDAALPDCPLVVTCTPASGVVLRQPPRPDAFIAAVGAFTPRMVELAPELCQHMATQGTVVVDTRDADHEAGDLLQANLEVPRFATLQDVLRSKKSRPGSTSGPVLFKSCGWAGWDLAAARRAVYEATNNQ
jgi:1-piperideine-2-carboxylate/1-pyrroline-2-carboxylate reductase [NAD(P)H]